MTPEQFCYWLQGFFEVSGELVLTPQQAAVVRNHLNLVFEHVLDEKTDGGDPLKKALLNRVHSPNHPNVKYRC